MKIFPQGFTCLKCGTCFLFLVLLSAAALRKTISYAVKQLMKRTSVWRLNFENDKIKLWTLNNNTFYHFALWDFQ